MTHRTLSKKDPILQAVNAITNSKTLEMITCTNHLEQMRAGFKVDGQGFPFNN